MSRRVVDDDEQAWLDADPRDRWVFDKLLVALHFGYRAGPGGVDVPEPGFYCVRPVVNVSGMGVGAEKRWLVPEDCRVAPGHFWCQWFDGDHVSVDYVDGVAVRAVRALREPAAPLYRIHGWEPLAPGEFACPDLPLWGRYPVINVEYIGRRVIELHLRANPDPRGRLVVHWGDDPQREGGYLVCPETADGWLAEPRRGFWLLD